MHRGDEHVEGGLLVIAQGKQRNCVLYGRCLKHFDERWALSPGNIGCLQSCKGLGDNKLSVVIIKSDEGHSNKLQNNNIAIVDANITFDLK